MAEAFCIHGHFYQPPRADPITGEIPLEPGAAPYRNWNELIHDHCYRPNAELGVYQAISFNIGPTLIEWMAQNASQTLSAIISQERKNLAQYGVGNAMAQAYNHTILPLATRSDKVTQTLWGIADFEFRFGHKPIGMWLPETAVDEETLEVLAECGIEFTILAPWQAVDDHLDPSQPYRVELKGGKSIAVFFYNQDISTRLSFDPAATVNADRFVLDILLPIFNRPASSLNRPQLILAASDGELYGHHQPFRDKFLAYLTDGALHSRSIQVTYPGRWLREFPPTQTVSIRPNTSWSCFHGVMRWAGTCNCTPQAEWKAPLRAALNRVAEVVDRQYLAFLGPYQVDPWQLRNQYIHVIHGQAKVADLIGTLIGRRLDDETTTRIQTLLQAQYERQRMFTSCGWFFDDFDRIEPRNNVAYAAQAVWLTWLATGVDLSTHLLPWFSAVKSWRSGLQADVVFNHFLKRARKKRDSEQI